jgi:hypothetical protein
MRIVSSKTCLVVCATVVALWGLTPNALLAQQAKERSGEVYQGDGSELVSITPIEALNAIASTVPGSATLSVCTATLTSTNPAQAFVYAVPLQGFPTDGPTFLDLSSGNATDDPGTFTTFHSVSYNGNRDNSSITVTCTCPTGRTKVSVDTTYCTEENPEFVNTQFQDPYTVSVTDNGGTNTIDVLFVDTAAPLSNAPGGTSAFPTPPAPTPDDVIYNACLLPANRPRTPTANLLGAPVSIKVDVRDAGDDILDTATFVDNLAVLCRLMIDLKPGSNPNCVNLNNHGVVAVGILSFPGFDATTVVTSTVVFAGAPALRCANSDVDGDGDVDKVCHFKTSALVVSNFNADGCAVVTLTAMTTSGAPVSGSDILCLPGENACENSIPQTAPF